MFCPKCATENPDTGKFCRSCGIDLEGVSAVLSGKSPTNLVEMHGTGQNRRTRSRKDPTEVIGDAVRNSLMGVGFVIISLVLFFTNAAAGQMWWWAMLFPAFFSLANGISQMVKAKRIEKRSVNANPIMQNQVASTPQNLNLPPTQTEYVKPQSSIYDTGELVAPPSVTEHTTKHLEMNSEGETMTLPKKN